MTDDWDRRIFDKELKAILDAKLPVSASKITSLQGLAIAHPQHHNYIVHRIVQFIETSPPDYRLAGLYVIDAISRAAHKHVRKATEAGVTKAVDVENYLRRFAVVFREGSLAGCFEPCSTKDKEKVKRTLDIWEHGGVYSKEVIELVKKSFMKTADAGNGQYGNDQNKPPAAKIDAVETSKVSAPAVDTASLLATLSSLSGGNLTNLVPSATTAPKPAGNDPTKPIFGDDDEDRPTTASSAAGLPPALAQLLGGIVSSPSTTVATQAQATPAPISTSFPPQEQKPSMPQSPSSFQAQPSPSAAIPPRSQAHWHPPPTSVPLPPRPPPSPMDQKPPARRVPQGPSISVNKNKGSRWNDDNERSPIQRGNKQWNEPPPPPPRMPDRRPKRTLPGPIPDPSLPPGTIRVLTRTLFVAPIHDSMSREDVASVFEQYGELNSLIISRKIKNKGNAFVKFVTRASIEAAKKDADRIRIHGQSLKINWAYGFGPKRMFNYDVGESIIPLDELSEDEKQSLTTAPIGGFQGLPVRAQMTIEEPEVEYRPEWKKEELAKQRGAGPKQQRGPPPPAMDDHPGKKRRRFEDKPPREREENMQWMSDNKPVAATAGGNSGGAAAPPFPLNGQFPGFPMNGPIPPFFMNGMPFPPPPPHMMPRPPQQGHPPMPPPPFGFNGVQVPGNFIPPTNSSNQQQPPSNTDS